MIAPPANAAGVTFALKPISAGKAGYFVFTAKPGTTIRSEVRVLNVGTKAGRASLYAVDATTGQTSGAVYRSRQEPRRDAGAWISFAQPTVSLAPGQSQIVPFSVRIPSQGSPGQHLGGIVAQPSTFTSSTSVKKAKHSFRVNIRALSVIAVQVNLPGPQVVRMSLTGIRAGVQPGHQTLLLGMRSRGNILVKCRGSLLVVNQSGRGVQGRQFNLDTFVPHTRIDYPVYVRGKVLQPGSYSGTVTLTCRGHRLSRTFPFRISAAQVKQIFGSPGAQTPSKSSSNTLLLILAATALVLLSVGATALYFRRKRV
ncbi:MAG TPA: DUF916 domain-containing protein [Gemmatimonadales bacterium]|nr:DUF916 domain-containing protein [Gemmatimonadales bacterium]